MFDQATADDSEDVFFLTRGVYVTHTYQHVCRSTPLSLEPYLHSA